MKHTYRVTLLMISLFFISQVIGVYIIEKNLEITSAVNPKTGELENRVEYYETPLLSTPPAPADNREAMINIISIFIAILIGTGIGLLLAKYRRVGFWKAWFLFAVIVALYKAFAAFIPAVVAVTAALVLAIYKVYRPNFYVHNFTEMFIYGGLAALIVPILNVISAAVFLILIAFYDAFAVWQSKHMITLAKFQMSSVFAGLSVQYDPKKDRIIKHGVRQDGVVRRDAKSDFKIPKPTHETRMKQAEHPRSSVKNAILGGGDIAFPIIFAGAVFQDLVISQPLSVAFLKTLLIPIFSTSALALLLIKAKKDRFYPAMPFIAAGCFLGYAVILMV